MTDNEKLTIEKKLDDLSENVKKGITELSVIGKTNSTALSHLMNIANDIWHETYKGVNSYMPEMKSICRLFGRTDRKLRNIKNAKLKAIAQIKNWLTFVEMVFAILEEDDGGDWAKV